MDKLKFEFIQKAAGDGKSNFLALTSISTTEGKTYCMPECYQDVSQHIELIKTAAFKKIKNSVKQRHQTRRVWITLDDALSAVYIDEGNNVQFSDYFLEELALSHCEEGGASENAVTEEVLTNIFKKMQPKKEDLVYGKDLKLLSGKFVLEKYSNKSSNVNQWVKDFEIECDRLEIEKDEEKIEVMRFFLETSCLDWYRSMLIKLSLKSEWIKWKENFCETYADKGWASIKYALSFKYFNGSLLDYALKKERILLEINKSMNPKTLIDLIATGLPDLITDRINREELEHTQDLFNELRSLEHLIRRKTPERKRSMNMNFKDKFQEKSPCIICEKLGKKHRYHSEQSCWFKAKENTGFEDKNNIKYVHNSEIEAELNDISPKNWQSHH